MARAMAFMQLLVLLLCSLTVFAEELDTLPPTASPHYPVAAPPHHHRHPHPHPHPHSPTSAPVHPPPVQPPSHPPVQPPSHPPVHPPHHHRRQHHHHAPTPAPVPVHPPAHPPSHVPVHPPAHVPAKPPTHHYPPAPAPVKPPVHPPVPVHPPQHPFRRSFVAVEGVVYCKSCKYAGVDTLLGASPVLGATVKLQCNNTRKPLVQTAQTDKNGYFFLEAHKSITTFGAHKCKAFLVTSPSATCQTPSNLHDGVAGAILKPEKPYESQKLPFLLYSAGPFAFEPKCPH